MSQPARHEIDKFANDRFSLVRDEILAQHEEKRKQVLREVRRTHNSGGYMPALVAWGAERVRSMVLARADATVESFELHRVPSDARAEMDLKRTAQEIAAGTISAIRGELDLLASRTRAPRRHPGGHLNREIEAAMKSALKEGVLRLSRQRITSMNSQRSSQLRVPAKQNDTKTPADKNRFNESQQKRFDDALREMNETFYAYEQMRNLLVDPEWSRVGPPPSNAPTMLEEVSTLERDIRTIAIKTIRVYAEASSALGSLETLRVQLQSDADAVVKWILATVNKRMSKEDISRLKWDAIEQAVQLEVENQIQKAEREWDVSPPWSTSDSQLPIPSPLRATTDGRELPNAGAVAPPRTANPDAPVQSTREWSELTITFISDERVSIKFSGADAETRNYEEMGFGDRRIGKPCLAWIVLRELSREPGAPMRMDKKRAQEIRTRLQKHFSLNSSPLLFQKGLGHSAKFKLQRGRSFDT